MHEVELDSPYLQLLDTVSFQPIFILGLHRSGTSILYKMLGETRHFNIVSAYHILRFDELVYNMIHRTEDDVKAELTELFHTQGITHRGIDHLQITPDFAQEYVYLLTKKSHSKKITPENVSLFKVLCRKIMYISQNKKPILLKNPYDFSNFLFLKTIFPNAYFIFIHRDPVNVVDSTLRAWQTLLAQKNPYTVLFSDEYASVFENPLYLWLSRLYYASFFPIGFFSIIHQAKHMTSYYLSNIDKLPSQQYISVRYEDLCQEPNTVLTSILQLLGLKTEVDFQRYIQPRQLDVLPVVQQFKRYITKTFASYRTVFKYTS